MIGSRKRKQKQEKFRGKVTETQEGVEDRHKAKKAPERHKWLEINGKERKEHGEYVLGLVANIVMTTFSLS